MKGSNHVWSTPRRCISVPQRTKSAFVATRWSDRDVSNPLARPAPPPARRRPATRRPPAPITPPRRLRPRPDRPPHERLQRLEDHPIRRPAARQR
jgi:hypothetical protein